MLIWVDYCLLAIVLVSGLVGVLRGFLREAFSLCLWAGAGWLALHYNHLLSVQLQGLIALPSARIAAAFLLIYLVTLLVGGFIGFLLNKLVSSTGLGGTDRLIGLVFGLARGGLIAALVVMLASFTPLPQDLWWKQSKLIPPLQSLAVWLRGQIAASSLAQVKFPK